MPNYPITGHPTTDFLRGHFEENDTIEFEGVVLERIKTPLEPGDTYIAGRNAGIKLLTVQNVSPDYGGARTVYPVENSYPYDLVECYKVRIKE